MLSISHKIAFYIILAGLFLMAAFLLLNYQMLTLTLWMTIFLVAFAFYAGNKIITPLKKLLKRAQGLSLGDLEARFHMHTKDELAQLAKAFNMIAQDLAHSKLETTRLSKDFDGRVDGITSLMGDTVNALEQKVKNRTLEFHKAMNELEKFQEQVKLRDFAIARLEKKLENRPAKKKK